MTKQLLILGCGYVGSAVAIAARSKGYGVKAVTRNGGILDSLGEIGVEGFRGAVETDAWKGFAGSDVDWVLNCVSAAQPGLDGYRQSYVEGNRSLGQWMEAIGFSGKALYTSSVAVYPDSGGDWVGEEAAAPHSERARILLEAEALFSEAGGPCRNTVLRLGGIYGPNRGFLARRVKESEGSLPGTGDYYLNLIRLEDIVSALLAVFESEGDDSGVYNLVDGEPMLKAALVQGLAKGMNRESPTFDPGTASSKASRRWEKGPPANRRISNRLFCETFAWRPRFPNSLEGMLDAFL